MARCHDFSCSDRTGTEKSIIRSDKDSSSNKILGNPKRHYNTHKNRLLKISFSIIAVVILLTTAFIGMAEAVTAEYYDPFSFEPIVGDGSETEQNDRSKPPERDNSDVDLLPPGEVISRFESKGPQISSMGTYISPVRLIEYDDRYEYLTGYGSYTFYFSHPASFTYIDVEGKEVARSVSFTVFSLTSQVRMDEERIIEVDENQYIARQAVYFDGVGIGYLITAASFLPGSKPKFSAELEFVTDNREFDFTIAWQIVTPANEIRESDSVITPGDDEIIEVADNYSLDLWSNTIDNISSHVGTIDWSDSNCSNIEMRFAKPIDSDFTQISLIFPDNITIIDPTILKDYIVYQSATTGSVNRNVFYAYGYYFAFFNDGYHLVYSISNDGTNWSGLFALPSTTYSTELRAEPDQYNFAISYREGKIAVAWLDNHDPQSDEYESLKYVEGTVSEGWIQWDDPITLGTAIDDGVSGQGVGVTLGAHYSAIITCFNNSALTTYARNSSDDEFFILENSFNPSSEHDSTRVVSPPSRGQATGITVLHLEKQIPVNMTWATYYPGSGWSSYENDSLDMYYNEGQTSYTYHLSAVADSSETIHIVYYLDNGSASGVRYARLSSNSLEGEKWIEQGDYRYYPSISIDLNDDLHVFYASDTTKINEAHTYPGSTNWTTPTTFTDGLYVKKYISSGELFVGEAYLVWCDCHRPHISDVLFGSLPLPVDVTKTFDDPWSKVGINNNQPLDINMINEAISPGNGLLTVVQSDISVESRGIGMSVERIFRTPAYWVWNETESLVPYLYEESPLANLGPGWSLNMPWIGNAFLHLSNGQQYLFQWNDDEFENEKGVKFILKRVDKNYTLDFTNGFRIYFNESGLPTKFVSDRESTPDNAVLVQYGQYGISNLTDPLGRQINFSYDLNGMLKNVSFAGQKIEYQYSNGRLFIVTDLKELQTRFFYLKDYLLYQITYPTDGYSQFSYELAVVGEEALTNMTIQKKTSWQWHYTDYEYLVVNGTVKYTKTSEYDGGHKTGCRVGYIEYHFDNSDRGSLTVWKDANGNYLRMKRAWYSSDGQIIRTETYLGDSIAPNYEELTMVDDWGNTIYTLDAVGREGFSSFAGTTSQYSFHRPGSITANSSGKILFDNFDLRDLSFWTKNSSAELKLEEDIEPADRIPAMNLTRKSGTEAVANRSFSNINELFYAEALFLLPSIDTVAGWKFYDKDSTLRAAIRFTNGWLYALDFGEWTNLSVSYSDNTWNRITLQFSPDQVPGRYYIYMNGSHIWVDGDPRAGMVSGIGLEKIEFFVTDDGSSDMVLIDDVKLFIGNTIEFEGLTSGQIVRIYDLDQNLISIKKAQSSTVTITFPIAEEEFNPFGLFEVREKDDTIISEKMPREFWPGDEYYVRQPEYLGEYLKKNYSTWEDAEIILDDSLPYASPNYESKGDDPFNGAQSCWVNDFDRSLNGTKYHTSKFNSSEHYHGISTNNPSEYRNLPQDATLIQWVRIKENSSPLEIAIELNDSSGKLYQAYWGLNLTYSGREKCVMMESSVPTLRDQWVMLVVRIGDLKSDGITLRGIRYTAFGGEVDWDYTANSSDSSLRKIKFSDGVGDPTSVRFHDPDGTQKASGCSWSQEIELDLYSAGYRSYPVVGYFKLIERQPVPIFWTNVSPIYNNIFGGDSFLINRDYDFYNNTRIPGDYRHCPVGTLTFGDGSPPAWRDRYYEYGYGSDSSIKYPSFITESKTRNGTNWLKESWQYDTTNLYGNLLNYTNPMGTAIQNTYYTWNGNLTHWVNRTRVNVGGENIDRYYTYDFQKGLTLSEQDPLGRITNYTYDNANRIKNIIHPLVNDFRPVRIYDYDDANLTVYIINENGNVETKTMYDDLGRVRFVIRLNAANETYSWDAEYYYDFANRIIEVFDHNYNSILTDYDFLGRVIKITNADNTYRTFSYDDKNCSVISTDELGNNIERIFDYVGNLVKVKEYVNSSTYYETNYTYNSVGELKTMTDALSQTTTFYYDNLGRLINTTFPDGTYSTNSYDNLSRIIDIRKTDGNRTQYIYDELGRTQRAIMSQNEWINYTYDKSGNLLTALYKRDSVTVNTWRDYDAWNRMLNDTTAIAGDASYNYTVNYEYDNTSLITNVGWEVNNISYYYDEFGRLTKVCDEYYAYAEYNYDPMNLVTDITYWNGIVTNYSYDSNRYWLERIWTHSETQNLMDLNYTYDDVGRITYIDSTTDEIYEYDSLGRLVNCSGPWGIINYTYDAVGNRLQQIYGSTWTNYTYGSYNRLLWANSSTNISYEYDSAGRLIHKNDGNYWTYTYDYSEKLIEVEKDNSTVAEFVYDAFGRRIKTIEGGTTTRFVYYGMLPVLEKNNKQYNYFYGNGQIVCKFEFGKKYWFYHQDLLGSTRVVTDKGSNEVFQSNYEPFGKPYGMDGSQTFTYTGAPQDSSTGLYYLRARYHNPTIGRFTQMDSWSGSIGAPQTMNKYAYCTNNPINLIDRSGTRGYKPMQEKWWSEHPDETVVEYLNNKLEEYEKAVVSYLLGGYKYEKASEIPESRLEELRILYDKPELGIYHIDALLELSKISPWAEIFLCRYLEPYPFTHYYDDLEAHAQDFLLEKANIGWESVWYWGGARPSDYSEDRTKVDKPY